MKKLLLVDGTNLQFQMFFGMPAKIINKQGKSIHGILGFVGALLKIIRFIEPTNVAVIFDGEHENSRIEIDSDYKANRPDYREFPEEENPFSQSLDIYSALSYLGIRFFETTNCETDDIISGYVHKYGSDTQIVISSLDSDFFQLISEKVSVLRYRGEKSVLCDVDYIKGRFGIEPCQYADFKSLVGDSSDNIRGAEKVGPKTASILLNEFQTLERVIENSDKIKKPSVKASIAENTERLKRNYSLIKLSEFEPLPFDLNDTEFQYNGITTTEVLRGIGLR